MRSIPLAQARWIWLRAQRLDRVAPFGRGTGAVQRAVEHLGYVQIDTIHVIERSHHHILQTRIPGYRCADLQTAQAVDKSVFEYWTHALAYVPTSDYRMYVAAMQAVRAQPGPSLAGVDPTAYAALLRRIRREGPLSIRDVDDEIKMEKLHPWASRKPSKRALQLGFYNGDLTISHRAGMLKSYELSARHFGWSRRPRPVSDGQFAAYLLQRALRSQGIVSLDSVCYGNNGCKPAVLALIEAEVKRGRLLAVYLEGNGRVLHWLTPDRLEQWPEPTDPLTHLLSPFDPLVIQRRRLEAFFGYQHRFEAYVPAAQRRLGYFALPVLFGDEVIAALDLKMDRARGRLQIQQWTWFVSERPELRLAVDNALDSFEGFQKG
ncbi:winged helix-turn-helix domain-containing protein [Frateuria aurantia]